MISLPLSLSIYIYITIYTHEHAYDILCILVKEARETAAPLSTQLKSVLIGCNRGSSN